MSAEAGTHAIRVRRRRKPAAGQLVLRWTLLVVVLVLLLASIVGFVFAGSSDRIAKGVKIAGVDVSGMTTAQAKTLLQHRSAN